MTLISQIYRVIIFIEVIISFYCILLLLPPSLLPGKRCISDLLPSGSHVLLFYGRTTYVCTEKLKVIRHSALWRGLPGSTHTALNESKWSHSVHISLRFLPHNIAVTPFPDR